MIRLANLYPCFVGVIAAMLMTLVLSPSNQCTRILAVIILTTFDHGTSVVLYCYSIMNFTNEPYVNCSENVILKQQ